MSKYNRDSRKENDTISWIPSFLRGFLGLEDTFERPQYAYVSQEEVAKSTVNWIPGPIRRWLGLEGAGTTRYSETSRSMASPSLPPAQPYVTTQSFTASADMNALRNRFNASITQPSAITSMDEIRSRFTTSNTQSATNAGMDDIRSRFNAGGAQPTTSTPTVKPPPSSSSGQEVGAPPQSPPPVEGYIQPFTYLATGFIRGALPPEGLDEFLRKLTKTCIEVVDMYARFLTFQTKEITQALTEFQAARTAQTGKDIRVEAAKPKGE